MGLLSLGTPLPWAEVEKHVDYVRVHGIKQLLETFRNYAGRTYDPLLWGDELEYIVVRFHRSGDKKKAVLSLRQEEILDKLVANSEQCIKEGVEFHPEYGRYMIEAVPANPYTHELSSFLSVEKNMAKRRLIAKQHMLEDEYPMTITNFPLLGQGHFSEPWEEPGGPVARSYFLPDNIINTHPRFPWLTANIRTRRGKKVAMNVPMFRDKNTKWPFRDPSIPTNRHMWPEDEIKDNLDNHIYMDAMGFGMGMCCLQVTLQASDITEARNTYDKFAPVTPWFLALSAATPIFRGLLSDQDVRWNVVSGSVDDRTSAERAPGGIPKSRYAGIDSYIGTDPRISQFNDIETPKNDKVEKMLRGHMPEPLVDHFAHLFIRDPLVIFEELIEQDDSKSKDHFENIQSTNWQSLRFKPPPNDKIGWRIEFRTMDVQITDFENAAFTVFLVLLSRALLSTNIDLYQPISQIEENMSTAHMRDSVNRGTFWVNSGGEFIRLNLDEIFNGCTRFVGLVPLVKQYLSTVDIDLDTSHSFSKYLSLISRRASGELQTAAKWIRDYVENHPSYRHDSVIPEDLNYDLLKVLLEIGEDKDWDTTAKGMLGGCSPCARA